MSPEAHITNCDARTVSGFGKEWAHFDQSAVVKLLAAEEML